MMNHLTQKRAHQLIAELKARNLFDHCTNESKLITALANQYYCYLGFDPTAESLHLGNYVGIIVLKLFQKYHFPVCALIGGATALIGDPSFKGQERQLLNHQLVVNNSQEIEKQISNILGTKALVVNNINFYQTMGVLGFLREVGKLVNVNHLLDKEALKTRLTTGLSYAEFSYPLLQG